MSGTYFLDWLSNKSNHSFWLQPLPSEKLDRIIRDRSIQKSIAHDKKNQGLYSYIEHFIVSSYARLIDYKLRQVYLKLDIEDFRNPAGFERKEKSSDMQKKYFKLRDQIEFFLKNDIQQHWRYPDAELNAFRRWVEIADLLLKSHCYEGFVLVFVNLKLLERAELIKGLPECIRLNYRKMDDINSYEGNHNALRRYIKMHADETDFSPLIFNYHAIAILNESITGLKERELLLNAKKMELASEIALIKKGIKSSGVVHLEKETLRQARREILEDIKKISVLIANQFHQCEQLLDKVKKEQNYVPMDLPDHIKRSYYELQKRFDHHQERQNSARSISGRKVNLPASTLYSEKLLPSFWKRNSVSKNKHWESVFMPNYLKNN